MHGYVLLKTRRALCKKLSEGILPTALNFGSAIIRADKKAASTRWVTLKNTVCPRMQVTTGSEGIASNQV